MSSNKSPPSKTTEAASPPLVTSPPYSSHRVTSTASITSHAAASPMRSSRVNSIPAFLNDVHPGSFLPPKNTIAASVAQVNDEHENNTTQIHFDSSHRNSIPSHVKYIPTLLLHPENVIREVKEKIASSRKQSSTNNSSVSSSISQSLQISNNNSSNQLAQLEQHDKAQTVDATITEHALVDVTTPTSRPTSISLPSSSSKLPRASSLLHLRGTRKKLVMCMIGLPARGKTYIAKKISRYLNWMGYSCKVFNIGSYRRAICGAEKEADFFDPYNEQGVANRTHCAIAALNDMIEFFEAGGNSAVYDGTNSTRLRRQMIQDMLAHKAECSGMIIEIVWIESICNDSELIEANIKETKLTSPDYIHVSESAATEDFCRRIKMYEQVYEPLSSELDNGLSYVQIIDAGRQVITNRIYGYLMGKIVFFIMNLRINRAPIYISRHGESLHNIEQRIGGDPELSRRGHEYGTALAKFIHEREEFQGEKLYELSVWTSTLRRSIQTASYSGLPLTQWRALIEIQVGICDNMTYKEIEEKFPQEFLARKLDKLCYRYPNGESYMDVIQRIEPCIFELERMQSPVLLVIHRAVARCLLAYFLDHEPGTIPYMDVPLHTVLKLMPKAYACEVTQFKLPVQSCEDEQVQHTQEQLAI